VVMVWILWASRVWDEVVEVEEIAGESGEPISEVLGIGVSLECLRWNMMCI